MTPHAEGHRRDERYLELKERSRDHRAESSRRSHRDSRDKEAEAYRSSDTRRRRYHDRSDDDASISSVERREKRHRRSNGDRDHHQERRHRRSDRETSEERHERRRRKREKHAEKEEERTRALGTLLATAPEKAADTEAFNWAKKKEKERKLGLTPAEARARDEERQREREESMAALQISLAQREKKRKEMEEQKALEDRLNINEAEKQWIADESKFALKQAREAAIIRVREKRAEPVDPYVVDVIWLDANAFDSDVHNLDDDHFDVDSEIDPTAPYAPLASYTLETMEKVQEDIIHFHGLETNGLNQTFWAALLVVCDDALSELRAREGLDVDQDRHWKDLQHKAEADAKFAKDSPERLRTLRKEIQAKLDSDERIIVEDWLNFKRAIDVWLAKARLVGFYESIFENRLEYLKKKRGNMDLASLAAERAQKAAEAAQRRAERSKDTNGHDAGIAMARAMMAAEAEDDEDDIIEDFKAEALDIQSASQRGSYAMDDKYRPRKPMYYNKVHTGYDWSQYNRTHYDKDNPPPKFVQGYKFNVFYPDLIDKSKPPTYRIVREPGSESEQGDNKTCLLIFEAGPPYETIAFRIVDKKWNTQPQRGFKAVFDRGTLHLWFNFQRLFYRK